MRKDNYQVWKKEGTLKSKLKLIKDLASRSCTMGIIASELGIAESTLYALRKTKESIFNELSDEAIQYIDNNFGDFNEWITTQIEATIYKLKN